MKVYAITEQELNAVMERAVNTAMQKYINRSTELDSMPERLSMSQAGHILNMGRKKLLDMVASGKLSLASTENQKYKFFKKEIVQWI